MGCLQAEIFGLASDFEPADPVKPVPLRALGSVPVFKTGQWFCLKVTNMARCVLNVVVFDLGPRWSVTQLYPSRYRGEQVALEPGRHCLVPIKPFLAEGYDRGTDIIKVFGTLGDTSFRWLELPPLDQALKTRDAFERNPGNPLEELLLALAVEAPPNRELRAPTSASHDWVTTQLEVEVERSSE